MKTDYMPSSDAGFDIFQSNFIGGVQPKLAVWGIPTADFTALVSLSVAWNTAWAKAKNKDTRNRADVQAKKDAKKAYLSGLRRFVMQWLAFNNKVSNANREGLGLNVKDTEPTPMPIPNRAPDVTIEEIRHLVHKLRLTDPENPHTQSKPKGVRSIQVFRCFSEDVPTKVEQYRLVGDATRFIYRVNFVEADEGKMVWYIVRYVNTRGLPGPWSNEISATVA